MRRKTPYHQSNTSSLIHEELEHQNRAVKIVQTWHNASTKIECLPRGKGKKKKGNNTGKCKPRTNTLCNEVRNPPSVKQLFFFTSWRKCWRTALVKGENKVLKLEGSFILEKWSIADCRRSRKLSFNSMLPKLLFVPVIQRGLWKITEKNHKHFNLSFLVFIFCKWPFYKKKNAIKSAYSDLTHWEVLDWKMRDSCNVLAAAINIYFHCLRWDSPSM